jgi:hypothetical protein
MRKTITKFPNYEIDYFGNVYNKKKNLKLKQTSSKTGYKRVGLFNKSVKNKKCSVHRLMCVTFLPNFYNKPVVDHKNRNRSDNRLCNLKWSSLSENQQNRSFQKTNTSGLRNIRFRIYNKKNGYGMWIFAKRFNSELYEKCFKTKEEAIEYRDNFLLHIFTKCH